MENIKHLSKEDILQLAEDRWPSCAAKGEYYSSEKTEYNKNMRRAFIDGCNVSQMHYSQQILEVYNKEFVEFKARLTEIESKAK